jgi:hypothetical protein
LLPQESVDVPAPPVTLVEESVHDRLVELVVTDRVTVPAKPFSEATVIVEVAGTLTLVETVVALAVRLKS